MLGLLMGGGALSSSACTDTGIVTIGDGDAGETGEAGAKGESGATGEQAPRATRAARATRARVRQATAAKAVRSPLSFRAALNPQAVIVIGPAPETSSQLLVGGTNYANQRRNRQHHARHGQGRATAPRYEDGDTRGDQQRRRRLRDRAQKRQAAFAHRRQGQHHLRSDRARRRHDARGPEKPTFRSTTRA